MANFAALVSPLSISGSRLTDGTANASGTVYFFQPGGNTPVNVYADAAATTIVTQPVTLGAGGKLPTQYAAGIFTTQPVRMLIQDVDGTTVSDNVFIPATAENVGVDNDGFSDSTLDDVLTDAFTSVGGQDWKYKESGGATARKIQDKFREIGISVTDFPDVDPSGVGVSTTGIQAALNRAKVLGGKLLFPPGDYKIDAGLTLASATGVRIEGYGATIVPTVDTTILSLTSCAFCDIAGLTVFPATTFTGTGISITGGNNNTVTDVTVDNEGIALNVTGSSMTIRSSYFRGFGASGRGIVSAVTGLMLTGGYCIAGSGSAIEFTGAAARTTVMGVNFTIGGTNSVGITFAASLTGTGFTFVGNPTLGTSNTTPISIGIATLPVMRQWGNGLDASATSSATGAAQTPVLYNGKEVILTAASGGAGTVTVNAPAILPGTSTDDVDLYWDFVFKNAAGGAVTWSMNAVYVLDGATAIPTTAAHTIMVRFRWDRTTSKLREAARSDTVT